MNLVRSATEMCSGYKISGTGTTDIDKVSAVGASHYFDIVEIMRQGKSDPHAHHSTLFNLTHCAFV